MPGILDFYQYYAINAEQQLKCKSEEFIIAGVSVWKMVARFSTNVNRRETKASAVCYGGIYCYACNQ